MLFGKSLYIDKLYHTVINRVIPLKICVFSNPSCFLRFPFFISIRISHELTEIPPIPELCK